jgi:nitrogen fixation protein FixH
VGRPLAVPSSLAPNAFGVAGEGQGEGEPKPTPVNPTKTNRSYWPVAIVVFFVVAVMFLTGFIIWAVRQREDLVAGNYYENGIHYQQRLDRLNNSQALAAQAVVTFDPKERSIVIALPAAQSLGDTGRVHLYRPSDARLDRELPLSLDSQGVQRVDARGLRDGLWKVRVEWSANGRDFFLDQSVIVTSN